MKTILVSQYVWAANGLAKVCKCSPLTGAFMELRVSTSSRALSLVWVTFLRLGPESEPGLDIPTRHQLSTLYLSSLHLQELDCFGSANPETIFHFTTLIYQIPPQKKIKETKGSWLKKSALLYSERYSVLGHVLYNPNQASLASPGTNRHMNWGHAMGHTRGKASSLEQQNHHKFGTHDQTTHCGQSQSHQASVNSIYVNFVLALVTNKCI